MILIIVAAVLIFIGVAVIITSIEVRTNTLNKVNNHNLNFSEEEEDNTSNFTVITTEKYNTEFQNCDRVENNPVEEAFNTVEKLNVYSDSEKESQMKEIVSNEKIQNKNSDSEKSLKNETDQSYIKYNDVLMFEDRDSCVKIQNSETNNLEEKYDHLSRIGLGVLEVSANSINFRFGNKLYRYDYYRINSIIGDNSYIIVETIDKTFPIIFMSEENGFTTSIIAKFKKYKRK